MPHLITRLKTWWANRQAIKFQVGQGREVLKALLSPAKTTWKT